MTPHQQLRTFVAAAFLASGTWLLMLAPKAAGAAPAPLQVQQVDASAAPEVSVVVSPPAELRGVVLDPTAFTVDAGGVAVPVSVHRLPGGDLDVLLVVDTSGSMAGAPIDAARAAAATFASKLPSSARVGVIGFGPTAGIVSPFTVDRGATTAAIGGLTARGETALYDAVLLAARSFPSDGERRRSVVLLSDGGDTASAASIDTAVAELHASGARLDVVGLATLDSDQAAVTRLAEAGAGRVVAAGDPTALGGVYDAVAESLVNRYTLTFTLPGHGPTVARLGLAHGGATASAEVSVELPAAPAAAAPPPAVDAPVAVAVARQPGWAASRWVLVGGVAAFFLALLLACALALMPYRRRRRLARLGHERQSAERSTGFSELAERASGMAERILDRQGRRTALNASLERAGIALRPGEFAVLAGVVAFGGLLVGALVGGPLLGVLAAAMALFGCRAVVNFLAERRRARFADQLGDTLQLLAGSLRAGYGLLQAVDAVAREADAPTADEFRRVVVETRLGRDLSDSLAAMSNRVGGDDFGWVVQAIDINREVGGDLAEILDTVAETIRDRNQLRRQVKALTAEGRLSAYILLGLPFVLVLALAVLNPGYVSELTRGAGIFLSAAGLVFMAAGAAWFKKLVKFRY